jgi:hypothetical protein
MHASAREQASVASPVRLSQWRTSGSFAHPAGGVARRYESDSLNGRVLQKNASRPALGGDLWKMLVHRGGTVLEPGTDAHSRGWGEFATSRERTFDLPRPRKRVSGSSRHKMPANMGLRTATSVGWPRQSAFSPQLRRRTTRLMTRKRPAIAGLS